MDKNIKILIADDSIFMRQVLKDILQNIGLSKFYEAGNGKETLEIQEREKPGLILLDLIMPEVDGMEVLKKIGRTTNILVVSAVGQEKLIEEAKSYGALGFVVKPFDSSKVIEEIKKILK